MGTLKDLIDRMRSPGAAATADAAAQPPATYPRRSQMTPERRQELEEAEALLAARPPLTDQHRGRIEAAIAMAIADLKRFALLGITKDQVMQFWRQGFSVDALLDRVRARAAERAAAR